MKTPKLLVKLLFLFFLFFSFKAVDAQTTGSFRKTITHNSAQRTLEFFVPEDYDANTTYQLVVGLHGCVGGSYPGSSFRTQLSFLADSINAIVVCPNGLTSNNGFMGYSDSSIILRAIQEAVGDYNIDESSVYLMGFSCNGFATAMLGSKKYYNFKGIIPFNAWIDASYFSSNSFNYDTDVPVCLCSGTSDPTYTENVRLKDSFRIHSAQLFWNSMPGIAHTTSFPTFETEVMECFHFFENSTSSINDGPAKDLIYSIYPNPVHKGNDISIKLKQIPDGNTMINIYNSTGQMVFSKNQDPSKELSISTSTLNEGIYFLQLNINDTQKISYKLIIK